VDWWARWRADLRRPAAPTARDQLPFLVLSAIVITAIAQLTDPGSITAILLLGPAIVAFVVRGLQPDLPAEVFAVAVVASVTSSVALRGDLEASQFLIVVMTLYSSWYLRSLTRAGAILVVAVAAPWIIAEVLVPESGIGWTLWGAANIFTFILGRELRKQQDLIEQLEQARSALAEQAVAEERRRIARELHDLAGHTLAAMLLHVTGARHVLRRNLD